MVAISLYLLYHHHTQTTRWVFCCSWGKKQFLLRAVLGTPHDPITMDSSWTLSFLVFYLFQSHLVWTSLTSSQSSIAHNRILSTWQTTPSRPGVTWGTVLLWKCSGAPKCFLSNIHTQSLCSWFLYAANNHRFSILTSGFFTLSMSVSRSCHCVKT